MSIRSLELMREKNCREEECIDRIACNREDIRNKAVVGEELQEAVDMLFDETIKKLDTAASNSYMKHTIDLPLLPIVVVNGVVEKFNAFGWEVSHSFNDGSPQYDWLNVSPPCDWASRLTRSASNGK